MSNPSDVNLMLAQTILLQLGLCLRTMDRMGADVSAAHLDAAIQSFRDEAGRVLPGVEVAKLPTINFQVIDEMIGDVFPI